METQQVSTKVIGSHARLALGTLRAVWTIGRLEQSEGDLGRTLTLLRQRRTLAFARDWTFAELLEWSARRHRYDPFLEYGAHTYSFNDMNRRANRVARRLRAAGLRAGDGVALMLSNHPRFLDAFFAIQKIGAYAVPVNTALALDGLAYILEHSEVRAVVCDHETAPRVLQVRPSIPRIEHVWVNADEAPPGFDLPETRARSRTSRRGPSRTARTSGTRPDPDAPSLLLYTSGTTGLPKAVVSLYGNQRVKSIGLLANLLYRKHDKLYTCLPLCHANALMLTIMQALWVGIPVHLARRFSASRFWRELADCGATQFNTVGSMIPILLKTSPSEHDRAHKVRRVVSAACPKDAWVPFEKRFGVELWEGYGAVDGGGVTIFNAGTAPIGSLGRPARPVRWKLVDASGAEAAPGRAGELWVYVGTKRESSVPYWKNDKATSEKVVDGWLRTGDVMQADARGFLYFVGRNTDSMRRRGENVSAYEVEKIVDAHPDVLESAAFGVPSPLGEQDIMVAVVPVAGRVIDARELAAFLRERLPKYAVPSYLEVVGELPKTGTHRVIKQELKARGVTGSTIRLEDGPSA